MNRLTKILFIAMAVAVGFDAYAVPKKDGYKLVWEDNFDGSALNRDYWNVEVNGSGCGNNELQYYVDNADNVAVRDGNLVITARRQDYDGHAFTSGRVNTCGKVGFTYGIVEARIKLPKTANGLWPAFWMMGDDIKECGWPACGETDVLEMGHADGIMDGTQERLFNGALHWGVSSDMHCQQVAAGKHQSSLQDGELHIYTVVWTPTRIEMFVDNADKPYLSAAIGKNSDKHAFFNKANFLLFNLAVGGDFPNIHNADNVTAIPAGGAEMLVDYVRVYQPKKQISLNIKK